MIIEDKWDINNFVGKGYNLNLLIILVKTSQESSLYVSKTAVIIVSISTNEYAGRNASRRGNPILILLIFWIKKHVDWGCQNKRTSIFWQHWSFYSQIENVW